MPFKFPDGVIKNCLERESDSNFPTPLNASEEAELQLKLSHHLPKLHEALMEIRRAIDEVIQRQTESRYNSPYPIGRCGEITDAVESGIDVVLKFLQLTPAQGVIFKRLYGIRHNEYFHHAFQWGPYVLDVANDAVNPKNTPVKISSLNQYGFSPIRSFEQFARVAEKYWNTDIFLNTVFPSIAPRFPIFTIQNSSALEFLDGGASFAAINFLKGLEPAKDFFLKSAYRKKILPFELNRYLKNEVPPSIAEGDGSGDPAVALKTIENCREMLKNPNVDVFDQMKSRKFDILDALYGKEVS